VLVAWLLRVWDLPALPPGLHHDEAIEGLNALEILDGSLRFWFPAGGGREPLFMYLAAGAVWALGPTALALRLLAAMAATLAVAASFALLRRAFDARVALLAATLMATSYWQVHTGRLGLRSALLAPLAALAFALLLRGLDRGRPLTAAAGGAALGLSVYC
jgi:4-amino-4-deoxy-L-arabinose transferase-like glycosyltransferase